MNCLHATRRYSRLWPGVLLALGLGGACSGGWAIQANYPVRDCYEAAVPAAIRFSISLLA